MLRLILCFAAIVSEPVEYLQNVRAVAAGWKHVIAVTADGEVVLT